jgi:hypothetical protein
MLPILVVTLLHVLLGIFWYSPLFLGKPWARAWRFDPSTLRPNRWHYIGTFLISLLMVAIFSFLFHKLHIHTPYGGMLFGFFLWLGLIVTTHFSNVVWAGKPLKVYLIDIAYYLAGCLMIGAILSRWR